MSTLPTLFDVNARVGFSSVVRPEFPCCADLLAHMDRLGIERALTCDIAARGFSQRWGNSRLLDEIAAMPGAADRLIPAFAIAPTMRYERGTLEWVKEMMATQGVRALCYPLMREQWTLGELEPVLTELMPFKPLLLLDFRDPFQKADVLDVAGHFPELPIIYTGAAWWDMVNALDLLRCRENILLDTSWMHTYGTIELLVHHFGARRVVFGTGLKIALWRRHHPVAACRNQW